VSPRESRIGVVVLTHDRPDEVARTLERMLALPERPHVVVVDNASALRARPPLEERFSHLEVVRLKRNLGAAGRNVGVARLSTPYVAFCDDDTWWAPGALAGAADFLDAHPRLGLVTGKVLIGADERVDPTCLQMAHSPLTAPAGLPGRPVLGFLCAASAVRRRAFLEVGGFEPRFFLGGEEALLAIDLAAAGYALAYVEDLVVHHHPSTRRDAGRRRHLLLRNALWCAWLRRPAPTALRLTLALVGRQRRDPALPRALVAALAGAPWVVRHRSVVPRQVECGLRRLDVAARRLR